MSLRTFEYILSDDTPVLCAYRIHHRNMPVELVDVVDRAKKLSVLKWLSETERGLILEQAERDHMTKIDEYDQWKDFQLEIGERV